MKNNAEVDYVDETGNVIETAPFYDPGLDLNSWYMKELRARNDKAGKQPHLVYCCGRKLTKRRI